MEAPAKNPLRSDSGDYPASDDEGQEDYKVGGYHAVNVGDTFKDNRYVVQRKLGWGHFSTVWLTWDTQEKRYVALKVQKSAQHYTEAAMDEITILKQIWSRDPQNKKCVVKLLDHFRHNGPNGQHVCMVFEYLGDNLLSLIRCYNYRGMPLHMVKELCFHILVGLDYLHRELSIIHTDLKPENVILEFGINPTKDPRKSGAAPLLPQHSNKSNLPLNSADVKDFGPPSLSAAPKEELKIATGGLTRNQKKKLRKKAKKLAKNSGSVLNKEPAVDTQEPKVIGGNIETPIDSSVKKEDMGIFKEEKVNATQNGEQMNRTAKRKYVASMDLKCKIVDFGNSCWTYKQFTHDIQTRQYRAPEVIIGSKYSTPADIWSFACIAFELATGDVLYDPRSGDGFDRDDDHLALMMELLGPMPQKIALGGRFSSIFFNRNGELRHIQQLRFWPLNRVLIEKYKFKEQAANEFAGFLVPLMDFAPEKRPTAGDCLRHPWLNGVPRRLQPSVPLGQAKKEKEPALDKMQKDSSEREPVEKAKVVTGHIGTQGLEANGIVQTMVEKGNMAIEGCQSNGNVKDVKELAKGLNPFGHSFALIREAHKKCGGRPDCGIMYTMCSDCMGHGFYLEESDCDD
eukprot:Gb_07400 [translate_table: standard]